MNTNFPRVLVTRAAHQASALGDALASHGLLVVSIPAIAIEPPSDEYAALDIALDHLEDFDWMIFTSSNAVQVFVERREELGTEEVPCRIASIGSATSRALRQSGFQVDLQPSTAIAEELAKSLRPHSRNRRMLLIRAESARDLLPSELAEAGADLTIVPAYRTTIPKDSAEAIRREMPNLSAITLASSSAVHNLFELCELAGVAIPPGMVFGSIGPITSATLRQYGYEPAVESTLAQVEVLASELARYLRHHGD